METLTWEEVNSCPFSLGLPFMQARGICVSITQNHNKRRRYIRSGLPVVFRIPEQNMQSKITVAFSVSLLMTGLLPDAISEMTVDDYEARVFTSSQGDTIPYRLFIPRGYDADTKYPLVLFHHGGGGSGDDNRRQFEGPCPKEWAGPERQAKNPCFIIAPQIPRRESRDEGNRTPRTEVMRKHIQTIHEILDHLEAEFSIDTSREYVTGLSMGGECTWMSIIEQPNRFAAAVPICAGDKFIGMDAGKRGKKFAQFPLWIFHGAEDDVISVDVSREVVAELRKAGGNPKYTEYPEVKHNSWEKAYRDPELMEWLFAQSIATIPQQQEESLLPGFPSGTTIYKPDKCWNGYTLVPYEGGMALIIDMNGNVVHKWDIGTERARLVQNGHLVVMQGNKAREYDWDGNLVWEYDVPVGPHHSTGYPTIGFIHHDMQRLPNGNTIFLYHEEVPEEYMKSVKDPERRSLKLIGDCVCEVNKEGEIVWEWHLHEHLDLNECASVKATDWTHTNTVTILPENHWYDEGHEEFKPGNVVICPRHLDKIVIIDKDTKEVVWTYRGEYLGGLAHPHEPYMIEPGMSGAGNILIYDNGVGPRSSGRKKITAVLEINPVSKRIVWLYERGKEFFSAIQGTQQRLANGNTFICESTTGRIFEVARDGEIVWEYVMPPFPGSSDEHGYGTRPHRYPYDYCPQLKALLEPQESAVAPAAKGTGT